MIRPAACILFGALLCSGPVSAQSGRWTAHTSLRSVRSVSADDARIWAATAGGVFSYGLADGEIARYTAVDGLHSVDAATLEADPLRSVVWVGYQDGVLDRIDPETGEVRPFLDIERARQFPSRGVNRIVVHGDSLLVATDFGLVVYDPVRGEVRDAYTRLGTFSPAAPVYDVVLDRSAGGARLWLATEEGVAWADVTGRNLQDPSNWSNERVGTPGSPRSARSLALFRNRVYVGTDRDLYERSGPSDWTALGMSSFGVSRLVESSGTLYGVETFNLITIDAGGIVRIRPVQGLEAPRSLVAVGSALWTGDDAGGLAEIRELADSFEPVRSVIPEGPAISRFSDLSVGPDGALWAGGTSEARSGFHRLRPDGMWTAFTEFTEPLLTGRNRYTTIHAAQDGSGWAASEGDGVAWVDPDGILSIFDETNSSLEPAAGTSDFVIAGGVATDSDGNLWVTTRGAGRPLHVRMPSGAWTGLPGYVGGGLSASATAYGRIFVDSYDQKWIILRDEANFNRVRGLLVVDTGSSASSDSDDSFRLFEEKGAAGQGLPGTAVSSVVEDRDGLVWIGTDAGIAYFLNTGVIARDASARAIWPPWADRSQGNFVLFGLKVNDLAVDPANRLWIATDEGAWLVAAAEAGFELVHHFTSANSPLLSDVVGSVAVSPGSGIVYFATDRGLVAWQGDAIAPVAEVGELIVYPNPYRNTDEGGPIVISGLVEETDVRVVTPGGVVVASFRARGGQATWDGRDRQGRPVPSGVYLVAAVGTNGEGTAYGRIAIIR